MRACSQRTSASANDVSSCSTTTRHWARSESRSYDAAQRALYTDLREGGVTQGGSTITQQLVKNLYVGDEQTFTRKIDEAALAWQIEDQLSKEQILARYLNTVYFGQGAYGVQAAARTFFNENAEDLSLTQSATLAGSIAIRAAPPSEPAGLSISSTRRPRRRPTSRLGTA